MIRICKTNNRAYPWRAYSGRKLVATGVSRSVVVQILRLTGIMALCLSAALAVEPADDAALLAAIAQVESGGRDEAVGDGGLALGRLQIHAACAADAGLPHRAALTRDGAETIYKRWMRRYCKGATREQAARRWNGGPRGDRLRATECYWRRVAAALQEVER